LKIQKGCPARGELAPVDLEVNDVIQRVIAELRLDLDSGLLDRKYGHVRQMGEFDAGLRLIAAYLR
jgi:hypothetical protein